MNDREPVTDREPVVGWKAAIIVLGLAGFLILGSFVMQDRDRTTNMAHDQSGGVTVGLAPQK